MGRFWQAIAVAASLLAVPYAAIAQIRSDVIARGLRSPVAVVADPTDRAVLVVVEQGGLVRLVRDGQLLPQPLLDLTNDVITGGERGLLGFAFSPDLDSRRLFVKFTNRNGDTVVARFRRQSGNPLAVEEHSRLDLQWPDGRRFVDQPFSNHNGGHLAFGPDGYLYIGMGDGGSGGDPMNHAQNPQSLLGKMLRIDVGVPDEDTRGYRIPEDNPFLDGQPISALPEIWAFGLRNPWRYHFDDWTRGGVGAMLLADVGQDRREEINFEPRGAGGRNYGWRLREGRQTYDARTPAAYLPLTDPIHDYNHDVGRSITGGFIYRGAELDPSFNGRYFYADFTAGRVFSIALHLDEQGEAGAEDQREHTAALGGSQTLGLVSSFGNDADGELLLLNYAAGTVVKVVPDLSSVPAAPQIATRTEDGALVIAVTPSDTGPEVVGYLVEIVRVDGAVVRHPATDRLLLRAEIQRGECVRVRAQGRSGAGPPTRNVCYAE